MMPIFLKCQSIAIWSFVACACCASIGLTNPTKKLKKKSMKITIYNMNTSNKLPKLACYYLLQ